MKLLTGISLVLFTALVILAGCTGQQPGTAPAVTASPAATPPPAVTPVPETPVPVPGDLAGDWTLTRVAVQGGTAVETPVYAVTMRINQDSTLNGNDGCNNYNAAINLTNAALMHGSGITVGPVSMTKKYCAEIADIEQQYYPILEQVTAYDVDTTQLTFTAANGDVLIYQRPSTLVTMPPKY